MTTRIKSALVLALALVLLNYPLVAATWTRWQVERDGVPTVVRVTDDDVVGSGDDAAYWISYVLPEDVDPDQTPWAANVDRATYDRAVDTGEATVRVLDGDPVQLRVVGQVVGRTGLVVTVVADLLILALVLFLWRSGRYGRRPRVSRLEALGDVEASAEDGLVEEEDGRVRVHGLVTGITPDDLVIDTADQIVVVLLDGHRVSVREGGRGQVVGRWLAD